MQTAFAALPVVPLYRDKSASSERVDEALFGMELRILQQDSAFSLIETPYRYRGYVENAGLHFESLPGEKRIVSPAFADVLEGARFQSPIVYSLPRGSIVHVPGPSDNGWSAVQLPGGKRGFMRSSQLQKARFGATLCEAATREQLIQTALSFLGAPYRWGGKTMAGIDCSGLCSLSYYLCGYTIYRDAALRPGFHLHEIPYSKLEKGDLLYFPGHMAMYLGDGKIIHATGFPGSDGVVINSLNQYDPDYRRDLAENIQCCASLFA